MKKIAALLDSIRTSARSAKRSELEFASSERIDGHLELRNDFIQHVLQMQSAFLSDESSLWDFHEELTNDLLQHRIQATYGVDVADIESGLIADIFDRIADASKSHTISH